ncbi:hook-related protein family [Glomus cerebriforme]|uniref:Hook-related protein family n=1 Tax=Glomus cerebriforme TaxID=658196 RepID=A0A397SY68_9GLOM|nr:hook-related protein family [Glomus cerebriforme]
MEEQDIAAAFVDWAKTFNNLMRPVNSFSDLSDCNVLIDIVVSIDPKWFKQLSRSEEDNWVIKLNKLKKLHLLLTRYYEENLGLPDIKNIEVPNFHSIAKESDLVETMKLCSLIVTLAVTYVDKAKHIEKIQNLGPKSQQGLMLTIEGVMKRLGDPIIEAPPRKSTFNIDDEIKRITIDQERLKADKEALEKAYKASLDEREHLTNQRDDLRGEVEDLNQKLKDMEAALDQSTQTGKADFVLRSEIDRLQNELQVEALTEQANEAAKLKDQLDEYRHAADKLKKTENVIEKYKKKLEENADVRRALKTAEQENRDLIDRNKTIEEEYNKVIKFRKLMEDYKQQIEALHSEKTELVNQKNKYEYEYKHMRSKVEAYEMAQLRDQETIHLLEVRLRELELGEGEPLKLDDDEKVEADEIDQSIENDSELSDALKGTTKTSLRLKINELERELNSLREGKNPDENADAQLLVLQHKLEDANRIKAKFETDYVKVQKEKLILESELERLQAEKGSSSNGKEQKELLETKKQLREAQAKLEQAEKEIGEIKPDSNSEARIKALEVENEELKSRNEELSSLLQSLEGKSEDDLRSQNIQLHRQVNEKSRKLDQLKTLVTGQHEIIENYKNAQNSFEAEREAHAAEIKRLEQLHKEAKEQLQKEISLVTSAWFNIGTRIQGDHVFLQRQGPQSFLNQQRLILDTQVDITF